MNIKKLKFYHFRNYDKASFSFEENAIHVLQGKNAQGKTNIIESIYFLSLLRSFRTNKLAHLIKHDDPSFIIEADVESKGKIEELKVVVSDSKKQLFRFNDPVAKYSSFVGIVNAILFCPDDMTLFSDSPAMRRKFIDMELIKLSRSYTSTLSHYQKLLKQRNQALKQPYVDRSLIEVFTRQMINDQKVIIRQRSHFLKELMEKVRELYPFFSNDQERMDAKYETFVSDPEEMEEKYTKSLEKDIQYKTTSLGVHKDDFIFSLDGIPVVQCASQGQKRSVLLSLKLGLAQIAYEKGGQYPILLLDDVFSELDEDRRKKLIDMLPENMQIFITSAEPIPKDWFDRPVRFYEIENGTVKEEEIHE